MSELHLRIVTPDRTLVDRKVARVRPSRASTAATASCRTTRSIP